MTLQQVQKKEKNSRNVMENFVNRNSRNIETSME